MWVTVGGISNDFRITFVGSAVTLFAISSNSTVATATVSPSTGPANSTVSITGINAGTATTTVNDTNGVVTPSYK